ncbi:MAG: hypothetical protein II208_02445 [Alphaproteobacteria bacterium]|nr:hypothetical protein [Alphaproteobacteria bacterium]
MVNMKEKFNQAASRVITYGGVMSRLNDIANSAGSDTAHYNQNLKDFDGKSVSGFEFSTPELGAKLGRLLSDLGIKYSNAYDDIKSGAGRLEIADADRAHADKIFKNWTSWVIVEQRITGNAELDAQWNRVVSKSR